MENLNTKAANLTNHVQEIAQTYYDLARINVAQAGSKAVARAFLFFFTGRANSLHPVINGHRAVTLFGQITEGCSNRLFYSGRVLPCSGAVFYLLRKQIVFPFIRDFIVRKIYDKAD